MSHNKDLALGMINKALDALQDAMDTLVEDASQADDNHLKHQVTMLESRLAIAEREPKEALRILHARREEVTVEGGGLHDFVERLVRVVEEKERAHDALCRVLREVVYDALSQSEGAPPAYPVRGSVLAEAQALLKSYADRPVGRKG